MLDEVKCAICDTLVKADTQIISHPLLKPISEGAKYYYDLWHFPVCYCPNCKYASADISTTQNRNIILDIAYISIANHKILKKLYGARPNHIEAYFRAGYYYDSIADDKMAALCYLQAYDAVYSEIMYWDENIFEENNNKEITTEKESFKSFGDDLFQKGIQHLKKYVSNNAKDYDMFLVLAGFMFDGSKVEKMEGINILQKLKSVSSLTKNQKMTIQYLCNLVGY